MANLKMLKLPKKPKTSASLETKQKYLAKVDAIKKENAARSAANEKSKKLDKVIAGISPSTVLVRPSSFTSKVMRSKRTGAKKATAVKRKPAAKKTTRRKR